MARKKKGAGHEGHENSERWLLTYADMITLLMAFFIMMYSMSIMNLEKFSVAAISIRSGFGGALKGGKHLLRYQTDSNKTQIYHKSKKDAIKDAEEELVSNAIEHNYGEQMLVYRDTRGVVVSIAVENLLFPRGSAELTHRAHQLLTPIARVLQTVPTEIMVEGHTCPQPISTVAFPSNWELSAARASSVVRFLQRQGVAANHLRAVGYADTRPRVPNTTEAQRAKNRRVDIVILDTTPDNALGRPAAGLPPANTSARPGIKPDLANVWRRPVPEPERGG